MLKLFLLLILFFFIACDKVEKKDNKDSDIKIIKSESLKYKELKFSNEKLELTLRHRCDFLPKKDRNLYCIDAFLTVEEKENLYSFLSDNSYMVQKALISKNDSLIIFNFTNTFYNYELSINKDNTNIKIFELNSKTVKFDENFTKKQEKQIDFDENLQNFKENESEDIYIAYDSFSFNKNLKLEEKLFNTTDSKLKGLFEKNQKWELWRKNANTNNFLYNLANSTYYIKDENNSISDEFSISLQKKDNSFYISANSPKRYKNALIQDFTVYKDFFVFKLDERSFILAKIDEKFVSFYKTKPTNKGLKLEKISINNKNFFSKDTNSYEVILSDEGCEFCDEYKEILQNEDNPNLTLF
ncbi:hypothetical protein [uncultured Campylobacter sp.]|uniref:hypothetical protein n=1 Tax=uncultured Campylobacter sp. TaxID=218934 RepID=UPI002624D402|nr:hypothetical protein [uncultured Campylobacter sp.]